MEFKGTKGEWEVEDNNWAETSLMCKGKTIATNSIYYDATKETREELKIEMSANFKLFSKAPEMLEMLNKARIELSRIKSSMMAHPDCTIGSEFDDYTSSAQECENEIELLIKQATEL